MKRLTLIFACVFIVMAATAHNPLQGTKWSMKNEEGKETLVIDFESHSAGNVIIDEMECLFAYGASHTTLFIKMNDCEGMNEKNIIPCCDQQSIPFRSDENGNLVLIINDKEFVLEQKR